MSHLSRIFEEQPIKVQNVNGFDLSHITAGTAIVGTLTPVLCRLLLQETRFSLGCAVNVELPPLASSFFGRIDACIEVFFVPCSILYGGWKQFISNQVATMFPDNQSSVLEDGGYKLPVWQFNQDTFNELTTYELESYCLMDYLRFRIPEYELALNEEDQTFNILPLIAYARIWDVFYRNPQVTKTIFAVNPNIYRSDIASVNPVVSGLYSKNISYIWHSFYAESSFSSAEGSTLINTASNVFDTVSSLTWPDGISAFSLRQRNYSRDYFTAGSVSPQQGDPSRLQMPLTLNIDPDDVDASSGTAEFTIAALRNANSLQKFLEANNYDPTYRGIMRAHFGKVPRDADHDEPTYIGRVVIPVYQKSVYNQDGSTTGTSSNPKNPYSQITGSRAAHGTMSGEGSITKDFKAGCFGYLFGIFSLVPHTMYGYGIDRMHMLKEIGDFPFPELQSVGMDSVKNYEVYFSLPTHEDGSAYQDFNYIPRYSYWKYIDDSVHGQLRPGQALQSFVLQRVFDDLPQFGTEFCEIPKSALDAVLPVAESVSHLSCWYEIYWVFKCTQPLAAFCIPTLGELQDTHTITTKQGGSRL